MYGRGIDLFTPLVQMWALIVHLWRPPAKPVSPRMRIVLRITAAIIALVATALGVLFGIASFTEGGPKGHFMTACFTYGLFGLPTSVIAVVVGGILVHATASADVAHWAAAVLLAIAFFAQWLLLAAALWRRSRATI